jgi:NCAIR mutase (PurE)-related protein
MINNIKISQMEEQEEMSTQENLPKVSPEIILNSPQIESMIDQIAGSIVKQNQNAFLDGVDSADINALNQMINQLVNSALSR